ncbi:hypothetical protein [Nesterenkonia haasae]|uniref:hypothetical protein n=1 Tax=Nesterenkonia haasae TaxID=2587813 RepID=UPI0013913652|nr:hypothetical protein [Nesterenkonia haasae]NDK30903.1 hypothetical protein [Nesterenkonia haasae]
MNDSPPADQPAPPGSLSIAPAWDGWISYPESWTILDPDTASRAYSLWNFAAKLNEQSVDDVVRGTVVQKLWNAVDQRIRALHEIYNLNIAKSLLGRAKMSTLDVLHDLGVIRPLILKNLKDVRNRVEHQDQGAPNALECNNLIDSVWYFLRSTDQLATQKLNTYTLTSAITVHGIADQEESVSIDVSDGWAMRLHGWFREEQIGIDSGDAYTSIVLNLSQQPHRHESNNLFLDGSVAPTSTYIPNLIRDYFAVGWPSGAHGNRID